MPAFPNSLASTSAVGAVPWRTPAAPAADFAARPRCFCCLSTQDSVWDRLTSSGHMFFHLRDALHQIMNCCLHQILDCLFSHGASDTRGNRL